ncbi:hypothetical protein [Pseudomonas sp. G5(2012)]|uniref:hypothetical protein n=1 Tax=Pseudomonas sp. G5(2012) TaxID=1268068 RepID=UPI0005B33725|nr:hypothetical protein [Pseudomonas sp. G5(2012)]
MDTLASLAAMSGSSQQLVNLASAFLGGSVVLVIGTTHVSPNTLKARRIYLILIASWGMLLWSMFSGDLVLRNYLAATVAKTPEKLVEIYSLANGSYQTQLDTMRLAVLFFSAWLVSYMIWWVFFRGSETGGIKQ